MGWRGWAAGAGLVGLALALRTWVFGLVSVPTASMVPSVLPGEVLLYWRLAEPEPGDVVAVDRADGVLHVKRVVAGAGQEVELSGGLLYVDGRRVTGELDGVLRWVDGDCTPREGRGAPEVLGAASYRVLPGGDHPRERVPEGQIFLLGDHRGASSDSRQWGPSPRSAVRGVVLARVWSREPCGSLRPDRVGWSGEHPEPDSRR